MNSKVGIVMPVLNNFKGGLEALESVRTGRQWTPYIIPNWRINQPLAWAWNRGVERAVADGCTHILIINDDILFGPTTIDKLCEFLDSHPDSVMVSACNKRDEMEDPGAIFQFEEPGPEHISDNPDFSCFMIRPETIPEIGYFDENFVPAYFEDNDYHYRIKLAHKKANATTLAPFYHYGSVTQNSVESGVVPSGLFEKNRAYFATKWGGPPGHETYTNPFNDQTKTYRDF